LLVALVWFVLSGACGGAKPTRSQAEKRLRAGGEMDISPPANNKNMNNAKPIFDPTTHYRIEGERSKFVRRIGFGGMNSCLST